MNVNPGFEVQYGITDSTERIALAEEFLKATTTDRYEEMNKQYPLLFGAHYIGQSVEDIESICELMRKANDIYALVHSEDEIGEDDMISCGISPFFSGIGRFDTPSDEIQVSNFELSYWQRINGFGYLAWLRYASEKVEDRFPGFGLAMTCGNDFLSDNAEYRHISEYGKVREDCAYILRQLINLHMADVATICDEKTLHPVQMSYSGISCIWLGLSERMSGGRAGRCEACGKPFVAYGERRRKRFCCEACKKWKNKHPDEMRGHWYYEQR